ncbi:MAG: hypothetical protein JST54_10665 [Deltaproteobacteria bacterium]|nr:hypothetical protein [Deltaproteobacteria bacterium]
MRTLAVIALSLSLGCANVPPRAGSDEEAQRFGALYLKVLRWDGVMESVKLVAPERQKEIVAKINEGKLVDKLKVTEFEAKDVTRTGKDTVMMAADLSWFIEPEVTVHNDHIALHLRYGQSGWVVEGVENGPIPFAPLPPVTDGGAP